MIKSEYKIVLPVKFSLPCEKIINSLITFKKDSNYTIYAVNVCSDDANEQNELLRLSQWLAEKGIKAEAIVRKGSIAKEIVSFSKEIDASAIIINKDRTGEIDTDTIGDISTHIIEFSSIPVIVFKTEIELNEIRSILLPLDVALDNKKKISNAIFFSQFFNGALIRLVCAVFDANDYILNRNIYQLQHLVHFIERMGCECTGEIMRCSKEDGDSISKSVVDYAERSEAEIVLLLTNEEKSKVTNVIHPESSYMLANLKNNIIALTP